jgi:hypothetical protein
MVDYINIGLTSVTVILWIFVGLMIIGLGYFVWYLMSFKNRLIVRDLINNRKIIRPYKWKEWKDKKGNRWLITRFKKIKKSLPPEESIDINNKGRKFVEAWRSSEDADTLIWIKDGFNYSKEKEKLKEAFGFEPLTTLDRELLVEEIIKSKEYEGTDLLTKIMQIATFAVPIILVVVLAFTLGDITEALTTYSNSVTGPLERISTAFETASENMAGIQNTDKINASIINGVPN